MILLILVLATIFAIPESFAGYPIERVPITSFDVFSVDGIQIDKTMANQPVEFTSAIKNTLDANQSFAYVVWIAEQNGPNTPIDWIESSLGPQSSSSYSVKWIPTNPGNYTIEASVWESVDNPTAFSAIWQINLEVIPKKPNKVSDPSSSQQKIENIDGNFFRVVGPFHTGPESNEIHKFGGVEFSNPYYPSDPIPPGGVFNVDITFDDGIKENIGGVGPHHMFLEFTDHKGPQAGIRGNPDGGFDFLISVGNRFISPLKQSHFGISYNEVQCKENLVLVQKFDGSPACVKDESIPKLIERGWAKDDDHPFGIMGPVMNQESCDAHLLSQWQPTLEGREMIQQFLEQCIQKGFTTPELVERGKIADNFTYGPIQTAKRSAQGDIEKTIEILEEMYVQKTIGNFEDIDDDYIKSVVHVGVDKEEYHTDDVVIISGYVEGIIPNTELNLTVRNPLLDVVFVSPVKISKDGIFTESLPIGGPLWKQNGIYYVSAQYGKTTNHTDFLYLSDLESDDLL